MAIALFEGPDLRCLKVNDAWRAEFGEDDRDWRSAPVLGAWMEWVYRTGLEKILVETADRTWGIFPRTVDGSRRGVAITIAIKEVEPIPLSEDEGRALRLLGASRRLGVLPEVDAEALAEPIPLSGEESVALEALRLLVERGLIGPERGA